MSHAAERARAWWSRRQERGLQAWDIAVPLGAAVAWLLVDGTWAWDRALEEVELVGPREGALAVVVALGDSALSWAPLFMLLGLAPLLAASRKRRALATLGAALALVALAGFVVPLVTRALERPDPSAWGPLSPQFWTLADHARALFAWEDPAGKPLTSSFRDWGLLSLASWLGPVLVALACAPALRSRHRLVVPGWLGACVAAAAQASGMGLSRLLLDVPALQESVVAWRVIPVAGHVAVALGVAALLRVAGRETIAPAAPRVGARAALAMPAAVAAWFACWVVTMAIAQPNTLRGWVPRQRPAVGSVAPDVPLTTLAGDTVRLSEWSGRPVLLVFWATWCGPCRAEWPHLSALARDMGDRLVVVAAANDEAPRIEAHLREQPGPQHVVLATAEALRTYDVSGIPMSFLIDRHGRIAWRSLGWGTGAEARLREAVTAALEP